MKRFAVLTSCFLLAICLSAAAADRTPVERYGQLSVVGNRLVSTKTGKPVQLRGMSFFWSMAGEGRDYYNADVVNWLADDWKVNVVRAAMGVDENWGAGSTGYLAGDKSGTVSNKQRVFDVVDAAIARGIYVIIDWHSHTANQNTAKAKEFFEEMATKYKDKPNVLYEIFNEPQNGGMGTSIATFWANTVKPYSQTIVSAIRAIDPNNIIIIGTPSWCQDVDIATAAPLDGNHLVYTLHYYSATHREPLRDKARIAMNTNGKAIFVSEFGVCKSDGKDTLDLTEADKWFKFLDSNVVSYANWSIANKAEAASALKSTVKKFDGKWTADDLTRSGTYIRNKLIAAHEADPDDPVPPPPTTVTLSYKAGENGKIQVGNGGAVKEDSAKVTIGENGPAVTAVPDNGYTFLKWSDNSTANPRTDQNVQRDTVFTASFEAIPEPPADTTIAVLQGNRVIPTAQITGEAVVVTPVKANGFSVGPIPTSNGVKFFWQGTAVARGSITVYNAVGNSVKNISLKDAPATGLSKRTIGAWDLTNAKGRRVPAGSYLLKGKLIKQDGSAVPISSIVVIGN